jgi:hypothetical protein
LSLACGLQRPDMPLQPIFNPSNPLTQPLSQHQKDLLSQIASASTRLVARRYPDPGTYPNARWTAQSHEFRQICVDFWNKHIRSLVADHHVLHGVDMDGLDIMRFEKTKCTSFSQLAEQVRVWHTHFM